MSTTLIAEDTITGNPRRFAGGPYVLAIAAVIGSALLRLAVDSLAHDEAPLLVFVFGVVIAALYGGFRAGIIATVLSIRVSDYLFVQPRYTFFVYDPRSHLVMQIAFPLLGVLLSGIIERLNRTKEHLRQTPIDLCTANAQLVENDRRLSESEERFRWRQKRRTKRFGSGTLKQNSLCEPKHTPKLSNAKWRESDMGWWKEHIHPEERGRVVDSLLGALVLLGHKRYILV